jgi:hypothetical protein
VRIVRVPYLFGFRAMAPVPGIALVRAGVEGDELRWTLRHEAVHHEQMRRHGWTRFALRYLFNGEWRARYEAEAYGRVNLVRERRLGRNIDEAARRHARRIADRYFPAPWPGRPPDPERLARLVRDAMPPEGPPRQTDPPPPGAA